jgi:hypothetical protein
LFICSEKSHLKKIGVVIGSTVDMFEVYQVTNADMRMSASIDDNGNMITHSIGHAYSLDYVMAFNAVFGRGDTAPNADFTSCDHDLVGTYKSIDDITVYQMIDEDGDAIVDGEVSATTLSNVSFTIDGQSESGCEFWGSLGALLKFGGVVKSNGKDFHLATEANDVLGDFIQLGVSSARFIPSSGDSNHDRIAFYHLSRSEDGNSGVYFNAIFEKVSTYTPVPPVIVIDGTTDATFDDSSGATTSSSLFVTSARYYHHTSFIFTIIVTACVIAYSSFVL